MATYDNTHKFQRWFEHAAQFQADWRRANIENFAYYDGDQWTEDEIADLEERGQQPTVLNMIRPTMDLMFAQYSDRRADFILHGREISDDGLNEALTHLLKQMMDQSDYEYYEGEVFNDGTTGGIGWFEVSVDEDEFGEPQVIVGHVPWEQISWDPFARKPDFQDARFMHRRIFMDIDQVNEKWPEKKAEILEAGDSIYDDYEGQEESATQNSTQISADDGDESRPRRVAVVETWYKDAKGRLRMAIWSGPIFFEGGVDDDNENPYDTEGGKFNAYPLIPFRFSKNKDGIPQGIVKWMKPEQDSLNYLHSKWQWNVSSRQVAAEEGVIENIEELRSEINRPDGIIELTPGALTDNRFQILKNLDESQHLVSMMHFMLTMGQRVSGINDATMGIGGVNSRSNQQEQSRILQGAQMQARGLTNLLMAKRQVARVMLRLASLHLTAARIVRITEPNGDEQVIPLNQPFETDDGMGNSIEQTYNLADAMRYDVILKPVSTFTSVRQQQMLLMTEAAKSGVIPPGIASRLLIELSDIHDKPRILQELEKAEQEAAAERQAAMEAQALGAQQ